MARILNRKVGARAIHGDKSAEQRRYLINDFRKGKFTALVATDVASRGLDIPGKDWNTLSELNPKMAVCDRVTRSYTSSCDSN